MYFDAAVIPRKTAERINQKFSLRIPFFFHIRYAKTVTRLVKAGIASNMICDTYLMVQAWMPSSKPPKGLTIASSPAVMTPKTALVSLSVLNRSLAKYWLGG